MMERLRTAHGQEPKVLAQKAVARVLTEIDQEQTGIASLHSAPISHSDNITSPCSQTICTRLWLNRMLWIFIALGVTLRLLRYLLRHPLWGDESYVAVNVLTRDYWGLLQPLDHGMACPLLFLWIERAVTDALGFSEFSLRLFPLACGLLSLFLFHWMARMAVRGAPLLFAVGVFTVSFPLVRYGGDIKPYASDVLASLLLWLPAVAWCQSRDNRWLWRLSGLVPLTLLLSHPAVFVAGGISLALAGPARQSKQWTTRAAWCVLTMSAVGSFAAIYLIFTGPQYASIAHEGSSMMRYWDSSFPPWHSPWDLATWLLSVHTGAMFAYPFGGDRGGSIITALIVAVGVCTLMRQRKRALLALWLVPFGLTLSAAAVRCYPYGGSARTMLFLAPAVCMLAGVGTGQLLAQFRSPGRYRRWLAICIVILAGTGVISLAANCVYPYYSVNVVRSREFARWFWAAQAQNAEVVCVRHDLGISFTPARWHLQRTPLYLCNQAIYSGRWHKTQPRWETISEDHPLRCVLFNERPLAKTDPAAWKELPWTDRRLLAWLDGMLREFTLRKITNYAVDEGDFQGEVWFEDRYAVLEFTPRRQPDAAKVPVAGRANATGVNSSDLHPSPLAGQQGPLTLIR
jgi:hypothetical protein